MSAKHPDKSEDTPRDVPRRRRSRAWILWLLFIGTVAALAGNIFLFMRGEYLARDVAQMRAATNQALDESRQRVQSLTDQAKSEAERTGAQINERFAERQQQIGGRLYDLKETTHARLERASGDMQKTGSDLKKVVGDLGGVNDRIATNSRELALLKQRGDRNYIEFDLARTGVPQQVGDIRLLLKSADPRNNRYTIEVSANDQKLEERDKSLNEPVQFHVPGYNQPHEIVVNEVKRDEVIGYLAAPKVRVAQR